MIVDTAGNTTTVAGMIDCTEIVDVASLPSAAANTIAVPGPTAFTVPSDITLTTLGAPDVHVTER